MKTLKFVTLNIPIILLLKHQESVLLGMAPFIKKMAQVFYKTKNSSTILELQDYVSIATYGVLEAVRDFIVEDFDETKFTHEEWCERVKSKFLRLCTLKVNSRLIEQQKNTFLPINVPQIVGRLAPKVHQILEEEPDISYEKLAERIGVSVKAAKELVFLNKSKFEPLTIFTQKSTKFKNSIFQEEILSILSPEEREIVERVVLEEKTTRRVAKELNEDPKKIKEIYTLALEKMREKHGIHN